MSQKVIGLDKFLSNKSDKDGKNYNYWVFPGGPTGLMLKVFRVDDDDTRTDLFEGPMHPEKTMRSSDVFHVKSQNATYKLYFFM